MNSSFLIIMKTVILCRIIDIEDEDYFVVRFGHIEWKRIEFGIVLGKKLY